MSDERYINGYTVNIIDDKAKYMHFLIQTIYAHEWNTTNNDHKSQLIKKAIYEQNFYNEEKQQQKPSNSFLENHNTINNANYNKYHAQNNTTNFNNIINHNDADNNWNYNYNSNLKSNINKYSALKNENKQQDYLSIRNRLLQIISRCSPNKACSKREIFAHQSLSTETITDISTTLKMMLAKNEIQTIIDQDHYKTTSM